jgi:hypothetical protein
MSTQKSIGSKPGLCQGGAIDKRLLAALAGFDHYPKTSSKTPSYGVGQHRFVVGK